MSLKSKVRYQYNLRIRPAINADSKLIKEINKEKYPFYPCSNDIHLINALKWLYYSNQSLKGRGFPNKFNIGSDYGLGHSYPETTGYTLCTLLTILRNKPLAEFDYSVIIKLLQSSYSYLIEEQLANGAFTGGHKGMPNYGTPSIFNTGQILLGLADLYQTTKGNRGLIDFIDLESLHKIINKAGLFLVGELDSDGSYKISNTYVKSKRSYYSRATYGLLRAGIVIDNKEFIEKSRLGFNWVASNRLNNGAIKYWGFEEDWAVLHTIAYTLRGLIEAANYFNDKAYEEIVLNAIDFLLTNRGEKFQYAPLLPSHYNYEGGYWNDLCVTGLSQIAIVLKKIRPEKHTENHRVLFEEIINGTKKFQMRGFKNNLLNGVMPASFPFDGKYQKNDMIEWGTKFFMDTMLLSMGVPASEIKG